MVVVLVVAVSLSLSISFFCSLMEACLLSISNANVAELSLKSPVVGGIWKRFKADIQKPIAVVLIINTLAHTIGAAVSGAQFDELYGPKWIWAFSIAYSLFMIQYTEILPKTLGVRFNVLLARTTALPLAALIKLFRPLTALIEAANRPFEAGMNAGTTSAAAEISLLTRSAVHDKSLSQEQATLISRSIRLSTLTAHDIMVADEHIVFLSDTMSLSDAFLAAHLHRHTRYPLIEGDDRSKVMGYVNFKDIVTALHVVPHDPTLRGICRPISFVPENMPLTTMLKEMIRERRHIALVTDSHQRPVGLVTLEDLLESVVGEIEDEYDRPPEMIVSLGKNRWRVGGGVTLSRLNHIASPAIPAEPITVDRLVKSHLQDRPLSTEVELHYRGIDIRVRRIARDYVYDAVLEAARPHSA